MTEHATLFAIKLLVKSLKFSDTTVQPIIDLINNLIESENNRCSDEWKAQLNTLNENITNTL